MVNTSVQAPIRPLEPFRETSPIQSTQTSDIAPIQDMQPASRSPDASVIASTSARPALSPGEVNPIRESIPTVSTPAVNAVQSSAVNPTIQAPPGIEPKQVGARTFALEYQITEIGQWGVSRVELWGTHDGGQTWQRFAEDEDHRSPMYVTVDNAGLYGFRIVVEAAGGPPSSVPRTGDAPELWVAVDLDRPQAELVSIQPGTGPSGDQLVLRWRAEDANLESRPIALFYSSRSAGPWSAIATELANTGEYAWNFERHVPSRIYLRLEARDTAGNLAAFQTAEPVALPTPQPAGQLQSVAPVGPTATGAESAFR